ncbi:MAG: hypothetical protein R3C19_17615 [Planctomycetaceae bacterium]
MLPRCLLRIVGVLFVATSLSAAAEDPEPLCIIEDERIDESSGIAVSRIRDDAIWIHNDSGDKPRLFLAGHDGKTIAVVNLNPATALDWEDMCSFEIDGQPWLLVADVGDNDEDRSAKRAPCQLYLLKEPAIPEGQDEFTCRPDITIRLHYEFGPQNCESVAVDPERREILLLTKSAPQSCRLYRLPLDLTEPKQSHVAQAIATAAIPFATAMDISADGRHMAIATMWAGTLVERKPEETWADAFRRIDDTLMLPPRKQGETIAFDRSGAFLYLNSEKPGQPLWRISVPTP